MIGGRADLGMGTKTDTTMLKLHKLGDHELVLLVPNDHPLSALDSIDLREIKNEKIVTYKHDCDIRDYIDSIFKIVGITPQIISETTNDTMIYSSVAASYGLALVPATLGLNRYNVKTLRIENEIPKREIYLAWKDVRYISPAVCRFRDYIIDSGEILDAYRRDMATI